ncbi:MAG: hypothetical protein QNJ00_03000 [Woeseiaceae bacterium]|nr:hypothetical protein [Woeseiaceae bacterium]
MRRFERVVRVLACVLLVAAWSDSQAQALQVPAADGWYSWEVEASEAGQSSCCFRWQAGGGRAGCDLDDRRGGFNVSEDCVLDSTRLTLYVRMRDGRPDRARALSADCPVNAETDVASLGQVATDSSVEWLHRQVNDEQRLTSELVAAISMHAGATAFRALTSLLEDRDRPMKTREAALFWLAQSDTDEAYEYFDRLLSRR